MWKKKYSDRLLTVGFVFVIFFLVTMLLIPMISGTLKIDMESRGGLLAVSAIQNILAFVAPSLVAAWMLSKQPAKVLRLNKAPSLNAVAGIIIVFVLSLPAMNQLIYWNANIKFPESMESVEAVFRSMEDNAARVSEIMLATNSVGGLLVNLFFIAILTAFGEELFFRGTLQTAAGSEGANHTAIWVVALIFSAFHFQIYGFVPRLILGAWFGYLLLWTQSVYVPMIAHAINNGTVVIASWLMGRGTIPDVETLGVTEFGFPMLAFISALVTLAFLYFAKDIFFSVRRKKKYCMS